VTGGQVRRDRRPRVLKLALGEENARKTPVSSTKGATGHCLGAAGAGKSSLAGLLLGWHRPVAGEVRIDGEPLNSAALARLRRSTVWVSPQVHLWNRSLFDNLEYGASVQRDHYSWRQINWIAAGNTPSSAASHCDN
jgi:ABC-type bacteriocin/lantibiotic exporter with double-glycine peptidase domain